MPALRWAHEKRDMMPSICQCPGDVEDVGKARMSIQEMLPGGKIEDVHSGVPDDF